MSISFKREGLVGVISLDRPDKLNAMTHEMGDLLKALLAGPAAADDLRCLVLRAEGRAFSAGGDVGFLEANAARESEENRADMRRFYAKFLAIREARIPTIALLQGRATGAGLCLALACDLRVAAADALLAFNFVRIGLTPGMGGTWLLPRLVGEARALDLALTGRTVGADEALALGLVNRVVAGEELLAAGLAIAGEIATAAPEAVASTKRLLRAGPGLSLPEALDAEAAAQAVAFAGAELREGVQAIRGKRAPLY